MMKLDLTMTYGEGASYADLQQTILLREDPGVEADALNLYPELSDQTFEGFGGAVTDSAGYVYSKMSGEQKKQLLEQYFLPEHMNYHLVRVHMDSCDFSVGQYEADSDPEDGLLEHFSMERTEKYILPMLRDIERFTGRKPELMLSPWSPPAFMKTNGSRVGGGKLRDEYRARWAAYICRYIEEFQDRGFAVRRISMQNEAKAVQTWDSCIYTAEDEKVFLRDFLHPAMRERGLDDVEVFIWDHNKERVYERMRGTIDRSTAELVAGAACHWYSGDHFESLDLCRKAYPDKKLIVSESCIEFSKYGAGDDLANAARLTHEIIGDLNHGVTAFYDWNLLLNGEGGPNHAGNLCLAPFLYDEGTGRLTRQRIARHYEHFSKNILPGSVRVAISRFSDVVDATAWRRPDGSICVVLLNRTGESRRVNLRVLGRLAELVLLPGAVASGILT